MGKQRNTIPQIDLNDKAYEYLVKIRDIKNVSHANYINESLLLAKRIRGQLRSCPGSYIALMSKDGDEVNFIRTEGI